MIIGIIGDPRTGKTLIMTKLAYENYTDRKNPHTVFGNYVTAFGKYVEVEEMLAMPFSNVDRDFKTLLIQEADKVFDRTKASSNVNRFLRSLTGQSGKRNLSIFYDTQFPYSVDTALTRMTELVIECQCYINRDTKEAVAFQYKFIKAKTEEVLADKIFPASIMKPYYDMYNTYDPTAPIVDYKSKSQDVIDIIEGGIA